MSFQTKTINSIEISFDKEQTSNYQKESSEPCDCRYCRNYYSNIKKNTELTQFLRNFGLNYNFSEEIFSFDSNEDKTLIHHKGCYAVFGKINGEDFSFEDYGVEITFEKGASIPSSRKSDFFWINIEADFTNILDH
jgi:hypothetical protein